MFSLCPSTRGKGTLARSRTGNTLPHLLARTRTGYRPPSPHRPQLGSGQDIPPPVLSPPHPASQSQDWVLPTPSPTDTKRQKWKFHSEGNELTMGSEYSFNQRPFAILALDKISNWFLPIEISFSNKRKRWVFLMQFVVFLFVRVLSIFKISEINVQGWRNK